MNLRVEERERLQMERRRPWILALKWAALVLIAISVIGAVPAYLILRDLRAASLARQASYMLRAEDRATLDEAWEKARAAARLRGDDEEILRTVAKVADVAAPLDAPARWQAVLALEDVSEADFLAAARAHLRIGDLEAFRARVREARELDFQSPEFLRLAGRGAAAAGEWHTARLQLEALGEATGSAEDFALLAEILAQSPHPEDQKRADGVQWSLASREDADEVRLRQRRLLARSGALDPERRKQLAAWMLEEPLRGDRLEGLALLLRDDPSAAETVFARAREWFDLTDRADKLALSRWLNRQGLQRFTIRLISSREAATQQDLFLVYVDAMALAGEWEELQGLLARRDTPLEPYLANVFGMRVRLERGETRRARIAWERALLEANDRPERVLFLARYAHRLGLDGFTREALEQLAEFPAEMRLALQTIIVLEERAKDTRAVWRTLGRLAELDPDDHAVANDRAYYALLLGEEIAAAQAASLELEARFPELLAPKMTRALSMAREGKWAEADRYLASIPVEWPTVSARWRALVAAVWAQNGKVDAARELVADVSWDRLLPEERSLLAGAFSS